MLLCIDIGNTSITLGCYEGETLRFVSRMYSLRQKSGDEYASSLDDILHLHGTAAKEIDGAIISSVVPELTDCLTAAVDTVCGLTPMIVGAGCCGSFRTDALPVSQVGADLIVDSVAAAEKYPLPCIIADLGTATKLIYIDENGKFDGCVIAPGMRISLDALTRGAALLPSVSFTVPEKVLGTNTVACMQSGSIYGTAAMLDGMIDRILEELGSETASLVATGGYSRSVISCCKKAFQFDEHLLLDGLRIIYETEK